MNLHTHPLHGALALALLASALFASNASAQYSGGGSWPGPLGTVPTPGGAPGGFLGGSDDCSAAHTDIGSGDVFLVPFANGSTGSEGQNEAFCVRMGMTAIDNDVWFDWTATQTGLATVTTCGGTSADTKIAIWPDSSPAGCPTDGTSLACIDVFSCGETAIVTWPVTAGATYTIQLGNGPGTPGGSGTFDVLQSLAPPCGQYDDGTSEGWLGNSNGGELGWLHGQDCLGSVDRIEVTYGSSNPNAPATPVGLPSRIVCYEDPDCDGLPSTPLGGMTLVWSLATVTVNVSTDILNSFPAPVGASTLIPSGCSFVMATAETSGIEAPVGLDIHDPTAQAWLVTAGPTGSSLDVLDLNNNSGPPVQAWGVGIPCAFLLRAHSTDCESACQQCADSGGTDQAACDLCENPPCAFAPVCFGDGSGGTCGCGNDGAAGEGCSNSTGTGASIIGLGVPSLAFDSFELVTTQIPNSPGLTFQGDNLIPNAPTFGDGLRCCGQNLVRWITVAAEGNCASTNQPSGCGTQVGGTGGQISQHPGNAGLQPGDSRCYQHWYRDPGGNNPCGIEFFNLSPAIVVTWQA